MKKNTNTFLIGLGGIGASYASMAYDNDFPISIICDPGRKKRYEAQGFFVNDQPYQFHFVTEPEKGTSADLILIAVKQSQLEEAIEAIRPFISEQTAILSLLNGISSERILREKLQTKNVLPAFSVGTDGQRESNVIKFSSKGKIVYGNDSEEQKELADKVEQIFKASGIITQRSNNINHQLWWKLMTNVGINQISVLLKAPYRVFQKEGRAMEIARLAMKEVIAIANHFNIPLNENDMLETFRIMSTVSGANKSSMLQDIEAGRLTEVDLFAGEVIRLGEEVGIPTPVNRVLYHTIKYVEEDFH